MDEATEKAIAECIEPLGYKLGKKIGEGSYANVYLAKCTKDDVTTSMACKILRAEKLTNDDHSMKFVTRELNITLNLYHPDIIHTYSVFQRGTLFMIFMRMAEYGNVTNFLIKHGPVKEKVARFWLRQVASGINYLHELDLIHRDLKCDNLLISINHNIKLADFGFARFSLDTSGKPSKCTTYCGSIPYTAPEILKGVPYNGKPTDLWSIGCILFVMLNKKLPFKSNNNYTKLYQEQFQKKYQWVGKALEATSEECVNTISKLLEPVAKDRMTAVDLLNSNWLKMDPKLAKGTDLEKQALEQAYEKKGDIKPYKFVKITSDPKNQLKILSQDNKQWPSTKELVYITVNNWDETDKEPTNKTENSTETVNEQQNDGKKGNKSSPEKRTPQRA